ncbi:MAG: hypothetical protein AB7G23_02095 [Vicinamibacterales bacterium]
MLDGVSQGLKTIERGFDRLDQAATRVARDGAEGELAGSMVDLLRARHEVAAGTAVVRAADDMIGSVLDLLA